MNSLRKTLFATLAAAALALTGARADTIIGGSIVVATDGHVIATYRGNSASYDNELFLEGNATRIFHNHLTPVGDTYDLGFFAAGTELIFRLHVINTGYDFYTGPASRNPDDHEHARITAPSIYGTDETLVEFEDLFGGGYEYNDLSFSFTNSLASPTVPPPTGVPDATGTFALVGVGALALGLVRRKK